MTIQELKELNRTFLDNPTEDTFKQFEEGAKLYYGEEGYKKCIEFFLVFGGADLYDYLS